MPTTTIPSAEAALAAVLREACPARDFTEAPVTSATFDLGRVAAMAGLPIDDVVTRLDAIVREALTDPMLDGAVTEAVLVFLWRFARQGYHGVRLAPASVGARPSPVRGDPLTRA